MHRYEPKVHAIPKNQGFLHKSAGLIVTLNREYSLWALISSSLKSPVRMRHGICDIDINVVFCQLIGVISFRKL